jgi:Tol biopolymer transport system component
MLHEMITAQKAFHGKTQAGLIGAILERDPQPTAALQPGVSRRLAWIISLCLVKDPDARWQNVGDLLHELRAVAQEGGALRQEATPWKPSWWILAIASSVVAIAVVAAAVAFRSTRREPVRQPLRFVVLPGEGVEVNGGPAAPQAAISPDGTRIVFSAVEGSRTRLFLRRLDSLDSQLIPGTDGGELPFWSPDGRFVAFFTGDRKLKKVPLGGGPAQTICDIRGNVPWGGGTWNRDGVILFGTTGAPIHRVSAAGGTPEPVTTFERGRQVRGHSWPSFLADGRRFLFLVESSDPRVRGIHVGSLGSKEIVRLTDATVRAAFAPPNYVLFIRDGTLLTQPLDDKTTQLTGEPKPIAERVAYNPDTGRATFTVSDTGVLVYRVGGVGGIPVAQLTWFDRKGTRVGTVGPPGLHQNFDLSRDGTRLAVSVYEPRGRQSDIWIDQLMSGSRVRLTFDSANEDAPTWSPKGDRLVFWSNRLGNNPNLYMKLATGVSSDELLLEASGDQEPQDWSPDGRFVLYRSNDPGTGDDLWLLPLDGDRKPRPLIRTDADETQARFSPDGRWVAYTTNQSGGNEVYVQPFPPSGAQWQVSRDGGMEPQWRSDGKELFYISSDQTLMSVDVRATDTFMAATPKPLFAIGQATRIGYGTRNDYVVARDGQRFLINSTIEQTGTTITVLTDWLERLK